MKQPSGLVSFASAIQAAVADDNTANLAEPPTEKSRWEMPDIQTKETLQWENPLFGGLRIETKNVQIKSSLPYMCFQSGSTNVRAQVTVFPLEPRYIDLVITAKTAPGVRLLEARSGDVRDVTNCGPGVLRVNVDWKPDNSLAPRNTRQDQVPMMPHTRQKGSDNVDFVFLREDGMFVQIQVSLSTRCGKFWIVAQQVYAGQVVRTTHVKAAKLGVTTHSLGSHVGLMAPLWAEYAQPGGDYLGVFPKMGPKVIDYAVSRQAVVPLGECVCAEWKPKEDGIPEDLRSKGFEKGTVLFFNNLFGGGAVLLENGSVCKVHFKEIMDSRGEVLWTKEQFPVLEPMTTVALRYKDTEEHGLKATSVCIL